MQEIKFRAWIKKKEDTENMKYSYLTGYMTPVDKIDFENQCIECFDCYDREFPEPSKMYKMWRLEEIELMQFTGLYDNTKWKDLTHKSEFDFATRYAYEGAKKESLEPEVKNAKKFWQGKEIYEGDIVKVSGSGGTLVSAVLFDHNGVCIIDSHKKRVRIDMLKPASIKVIGNIHENPELLRSQCTKN